MPVKNSKKPFLEKYRGKWAIVWWDNGKRKRTSTGHEDEAGARRCLVDFENALISTPSRYLLADALLRYLASRKGKVVAFERAQQICERLTESLGHLRIDQITQRQWDGYAQTRYKKPHYRAKTIPKNELVSLGTLKREFNVFRAALNLAHKEGHLNRMVALEAPGDSAPRDRYLTTAEARALLHTAERTPHLHVFVALALYTGARRGSVQSLTWDRVDFSMRMIDFQEPGRVLTGKRRAVVPMNSKLEAILARAFNARTSKYVVEFNGKQVSTGITRPFQKACKIAGIEWGATPHHLKHTVVSWLAMKKVPVGQIADLVATDARTISRIYRKFNPEYLREVAELLDF